MSTPMDLKAMSEAAARAVADACAVCRHLQGGVSALSKADLSPVTVADFAAQAVVSRRLASEFGGVRIVGEESGDLLRKPENARAAEAALRAIQAALPHDPDWQNASTRDLVAAVDLGSAREAGADTFWTLDPIDGTKGFLRGQQYCTALALISAGRPTIGVLGCPNLRRSRPAGSDESRDAPATGVLLSAVHGRGAFVSDLSLDATEALAPSPPTNVGLLLASSLVTNDEVKHATQRVLARLRPGSREVLLDSQAKYAAVALGQADAFLRLPLARRTPEAIWDHAAGVIVCLEAGCLVTDARGRGLDFGVGTTLSNNRGVIAARPAVHAELLAALAELGLDAA